MKKMFLMLILVFTTAHAAEKGKIIDLGEVLQVQGELRKPMLQYIGSDRNLKGLLAETAKQEIKAFESSLVQFTTPEKYKDHKTASGGQR